MNIKKTNWQNSFSCVGKAVINDKSFKIDETSESGWRYNSLNLGIDCGEEFGTVFANMMGGYSTKRDNVIYVHGKNDDDSDNFENQFEVAWEDRLNDEITDTIGKFCFVTVTLEKTSNGNDFTKRFLSSYDAVAYIKEHLNSGDMILVRGNIRYNFYEGKVSMQRNINDIRIVSADTKCRASFMQSVLIDENSVDFKEDVDKEKNCVYVHGRILEYVKEMNGREIRGQYPFPFTFEYEIPESGLNKEACKLMFSSPKGKVKQVNFEGKFVNVGSVVTATMEDVPEDVKALIAMGLYTEEEILTKYASNGAVERRNVIVRPMVKMDDANTPIPQIFEERYTDEDFEDVGVVAPIIDDDLDDFLNDLIG